MMWENNLIMTLALSLMFLFIFIRSIFSYSIKLSLAVLMGTLFFTMSNHMWLVYFFYEVSMIPMLLMILNSGLNPYRFNAFYFMMVYSMLLSLPTLAVLVLNMKTHSTLIISYPSFYYSPLSFFCLLLMFFVKTPVYLLHFWLPKAHVEASTLGSMILASMMLKMGSLGCLKIMLWKTSMVISNKSYFLPSIVILGFICMFQSDLKKLIALSSVIHMMMSLVCVFNLSGLNFKGFLIVNLNHSLNSALMFYFMGVMYKISGSRMVYLQSLMKFNLLFMILIILILLNLGVPPFFTFLGEVIFFSMILVNNFMFFSLSLFLVLMITCYTLILLNHFKYSKCLKLKFYSPIIFLGASLFSVFMWVPSWV